MRTIILTLSASVALICGTNVSNLFTFLIRNSNCLFSSSMLLSLESGEPCGQEKQYVDFSRNTVKGVKKHETGVTMSWLYKLDDLETTSLVDTETEILNDEDNGQYFVRPENAVGLVVHSVKYPAVVAAWYRNDHKGFWHIYGEQGIGTQQTFYLSGATTVFVGLF